MRRYVGNLVVFFLFWATAAHAFASTGGLAGTAPATKQPSISSPIFDPVGKDGAFTIRLLETHDIPDIEEFYQSNPQFEPDFDCRKELIGKILTDSLKSSDYRVFAIAETSKGQAVGFILYSRLCSGKPFIGYSISDKYWRQGIMSEAVKQTSAFILGMPGVIAIRGTVFARNIGSRRVMEKVGFKYVETKSYCKAYIPINEIDRLSRFQKRRTLLLGGIYAAESL